MKFSSSLKFNAVSEWWDHYIAYDALKKYIYQLEKHAATQSQSQSTSSPSQPAADLTASFTQYHDDLESNEQTSLLGNSRSSLEGAAGLKGTDAMFVPLLNRELKKIVLFYEEKEKELFKELEELEESIAKAEEEGMWGHGFYDDDVEEDDEDDEDDDDEEGANGNGQQARKQKRALNLSQTSSTLDAQRRRRKSSVSYGEGSQTLARSTGDARNHSPTSRRLSLSSSDHDLHPPNPNPRANGGRFLSATRALLPTILGGPQSPSISGPPTIWTSRTNYAYDTRLLFKRLITRLFVLFTQLSSYVSVNYSGLRKILKKYDKVTFSSLLPSYLPSVVDPALPFNAESKAKVEEAIKRLVGMYARCVTRGDEGEAGMQLRLYQRENVAWERDTVWRQMIGRERRGEANTSPPSLPSAGGPGLGLSRPEGTAGYGAAGARGTLVQEKSTDKVLVQLGRVGLTRKVVYAAIAVVVFGVLLGVQSVEGVEANNCFAVLVFATVLWATEAIPLFVTSLMVPMLLIVLRVVKDEEGERMSTQDTTKYIFSVLFSPTIMLLIGGFTISSALSKTSIDRVIITKVLSFAGTSPNRVLAAVMGVSWGASMWISNVAAPLLCFTLIRPILRTLPPKSTYGSCLIMSIALSANIGGQASPISSPQNLIALSAMEPPLDWSKWFAVSIPVSLISLVIIWGMLIASYGKGWVPRGYDPANANTTDPTHTLALAHSSSVGGQQGHGLDEGDEVRLEIKPIRATKEPFTAKQWFVTFVCVLTIALWCVEKEIEEYVGDMGVIAIMPIVVFFATGVLKKDDFEQFAWTIVFLAMGGIALGKGVMASGLLEVLDAAIRKAVDGMGLYTVVMALSAVVLVVSTFISHTIASVLLVPIAKEVGNNLGGHGNLLVFLTGLICSTGMGMPVSGFPNQTAATQEDEMGVLYLSNKDFLKNGVPASIVATLVVATVGFLLMKAIGL